FASTTPTSITSWVALKGIGYSSNDPREDRIQYQSVQVSSRAKSTTTSAATSNPPSANSLRFIDAADRAGRNATSTPALPRQANSTSNILAHSSRNSPWSRNGRSAARRDKKRSYSAR